MGTQNMTNVIACIDGSPSAAAVCDYAAWSSQRMSAPLTLLHVIDRSVYPLAGDLSGNIGLGSREQLLAELAGLDEKRARLAREQGQLMLEAARERVIAAGVAEPEMRQRHGSLVETLRDHADQIRLLVIGKRGEDSVNPDRLIGSQLENAIRSMQRPVLVTPGEFKTPHSTMLAFDGSATADKSVQMIASSPLLQGYPIHVVMVGSDNNKNKAQLEQAEQHLHSAGFDVRIALLDGDVEETLLAYQVEHEIALLAMGAYGHSRIREFFVGSTTTSMLRQAQVPVLMLR
jgi:nucleotide-binding universal stress UspA family protein